MENDDTHKTFDDIILDYLREDGSLPPVDPDGIISAVVAKARRAEFAQGEERNTRLVLDKDELTPHEIRVLNDSSWTVVAELPANNGHYTHLIRSGDSLYAAGILWL
jgi:hypothetical protein